MKDIDKLMTIAQTYSYINGKFTARQLYDFIQNHNFKFHSDFTSKRIGWQLAKSSKFNVIKESSVKYEAI